MSKRATSARKRGQLEAKEIGARWSDLGDLFGNRLQGGKGDADGKNRTPAQRGSEGGVAGSFNQRRDRVNKTKKGGGKIGKKKDKFVLYFTTVSGHGAGRASPHRRELSRKGKSDQRVSCQPLI